MDADQTHAGLGAVAMTAVAVAFVRAQETQWPDRLFADPLASEFGRRRLVPSRCRTGLSVEDDAESVGFDDIYLRAGGDLDAIPWARLAPHPALVGWLDQQPGGSGRRALVVGCGLGDDAEELARRHYRVTAFDLSPTAIAWCRRRFPRSPVDYHLADLFALPGGWVGEFDLVVEISTLQSLPPARRAAAVAAIASTLRSGGRLFVRCLARGDEAATGSRPWPVSRTELRAFVDAGLRELEVVDEIPRQDGKARLRALYERP